MASKKWSVSARKTLAYSIVTVGTAVVAIPSPELAALRSLRNHDSAAEHSPIAPYAIASCRLRYAHFPPKTTSLRDHTQSLGSSYGLKPLFRLLPSATDQYSTKLNGIAQEAAFLQDTSVSWQEVDQTSQQITALSHDTDTPALAQRSSRSARVMHNLIDGTIAKSGGRDDRLKDLSAPTEAIPGQVQQVRALVLDVSDSRQKPKRSQKKMTTEVHDIETVRQHSAATGPRAAAAGEQLEAQSDCTKSLAVHLNILLGSKYAIAATRSNGLMSLSQRADI